MTISNLIKTLQAAKKEFGDVPVLLMNEENGYWWPVLEVAKSHPNGENGFLDRSQPVNGIRLCRRACSASDLLIG